MTPTGVFPHTHALAADSQVIKAGTPPIPPSVSALSPPRRPPHVMSTAAASRNVIKRLINAAQHTACPCHGCRTGGAHNPFHALQQMRKYATPVENLPVEKEYAFEVRFMHCQSE